ncbi:MAG: hypothetical protein WB660_06835 [Candidatus Sulfotelmatobacter sp.]
MVIPGPLHSNVWGKQREKQLAANPETAKTALAAAENMAKILWQALDGSGANLWSLIGLPPGRWESSKRENRNGKGNPHRHAR